MAKAKTLANCTSCGYQLSKNIYCKHCRRRLADIETAIFCSWCKKEIEDGEAFELAKDDSFCHAMCVGEKNAIGKYMEEMDSSGEMLLDTISAEESSRPVKTPPKPCLEEMPVTVKAILAQMNATDWKLESIIFNTTPDEKENATPTPPSPTSRRQR